MSGPSRRGLLPRPRPSGSLLVVSAPLAEQVRVLVPNSPWPRSTSSGR
ncbi:hypothetical protein [Actinomycetospora atypica]